MNTDTDVTVALTPDSVTHTVTGRSIRNIPVLVRLSGSVSAQQRGGVRVVSHREAGWVLHLSTDFGRKHATAYWNPQRREYAVRPSSGSTDAWELNGYVLTGTEPGWKPVLPVGAVKLRPWHGLYGSGRRFVSDDSLRRAEDVVRAYDTNYRTEVLADDDPHLFRVDGRTTNLAVSALTQALHEHDAALTDYVLDLVASAIAQGADAAASVEHVRAMLGPCGCACAGVFPHTALQHENESCPGQTFDPPCGGCWNCMAMQVAHTEQQEVQHGHD